MFKHLSKPLLFSKSPFRLTFLSAVMILAISAASAQAQTIEVLRVDINNGSTSGDGSDWGADAFKYLQDALDAAEALVASPFVDSVHVWVAQGTYYPDQNTSNPGGTDDREASFHLR